jgi:hypothetical protein
MGEVAMVIEKARHDGCRTQDDRVNSDSGNEIKDSPPPMEGGNTQFTIDD